MTVQCFIGLLRPTRGQKVNWWLIAYVSVIISMATIGLGTNIKFNEMTYIDYRDYPGGPNAFTVDFYSNWVNIFGFAAFVLLTSNSLGAKR